MQVRYELVAGVLFREISEIYAAQGAAGLLGALDRVADVVDMFEPARR